ncbi:hypothetical protein Tco_0122624 [Tanacetum coccineum]
MTAMSFVNDAHFTGLLAHLSALMCEVVKDLMTKDMEEEPWSWVARDILLDTWTTLITETNNPGVKSLIPPEGLNAAANLFALIVESELKALCFLECKNPEELKCQAVVVYSINSYGGTLVHSFECHEILEIYLFNLSNTLEKLKIAARVITEIDHPQYIIV